MLLISFSCEIASKLGQPRTFHNNHPDFHHQFAKKWTFHLSLLGAENKAKKHSPKLLHLLPGHASPALSSTHQARDSSQRRARDDLPEPKKNALDVFLLFLGCSLAWGRGIVNGRTFGKSARMLDIVPSISMRYPFGIHSKFNQPLLRIVGTSF